MIADFLAARRYLAPGAVSFWKWSSDGEAIEWTDGTTIAFRPELEPILAHFAPRGLPPFDALVTLLAACRAFRQAESSQHERLEGEFFERLPEWRYDFRVLWQYEIQKLPTPQQVLVQPQFADRIFDVEEWPICTTPAEAERILKAYAAGLPAEFLAPRTRAAFDPEVCRGQLHQLRTRVRDLAAHHQEYELRERTGLEQLVEPAPLEPVPPELPVRTARELITHLQRDEELGGVARLARNLLAVTHLPRGLSDPDDLPIGGISDITNRGPLDRLLLSELAHDDLTLTVRVAVNEALYLRRETPPRTPPRRRGILIETGIRTWGVPRVFATAVALALAATTERSIAVSTFRPRGERVEPADLLTRGGLIEQLAALETQAHPGAALERFFAALGDDPGDAVLVLTEETAADPDFRRALAELEPVSLYLATVGRDGRFELWSRSPRGSKRIREARLSLDDLLSAPEPATIPLIDKSLAPGLPVIFSIRPFPLLLPHPHDPQRLCSVGTHGILALVNDRRLMWWKGPEQGAQELMDDLPRGPLQWSSYDPSAECARLVIGATGAAELILLTVFLPGGQATLTHLELDDTPGGIREVCRHNGAILVIRRNGVDVFDSSTGRRIQTMHVVGFQWMGGRFFVVDAGSARQWAALGFDGQTARFEFIASQPAACLKPPNKYVHLVAMFEPEASDGPLGIISDGNLYSTTQQTIRAIRHNLPTPVKLEAVSQDGRKVVVRGGPTVSQASECREIDSETGNTSYVSRSITRPTYVEAILQFRYIRQRSLRTRFKSIGVVLEHESADRRLVLTTQKGLLSIQLNAGQLVLQRMSDQDFACALNCPFEPLDTPLKKGYGLKVAVSNDGSRMVLDARGLLHLKSSDPAIPELSIVLTDYVLAGWCSDGRMFGPRYFIGKHPETSPPDIFHAVLAPFVQRLS